ncbi:M81 family metallopeptidase [Alcaligenes sp.]|uniref:M81 family metallopeptidase n=1 Tax=Alcaligenes sp. TaxID=512 RepID=UPI003CFF33CF
MRIAVAGFQHETNTFGPAMATMVDFEHGGGWPGMCRAEAIEPALRGANIPAAGFMAAAAQAGVECVPLLWAAASPSAPVEAMTYEAIVAEILYRLEQVLPVDAVYLDLHGAMVAEHRDDGEGHLLVLVREMVGPDVPVVASLDLHANVSDTMLAQADMLVAYKTYPHVDMGQTGERTFQALMRCLQSGRRPKLAWHRLPFLIPAVWQSTEMEPAASLYRHLSSLEEIEGEGSVSFAMGFPAADVPECGAVLWAYAQTQEEADSRLADFLDEVLDKAQGFQGKLYEPDEAVQWALSHPGKGPVIIADAHDNPGGGASSDTCGLLRALLKAKVSDAALGLIVDPESAALVHQAGAGKTIELSLGGKSGVPGDMPLHARFYIESVSDGQFRATGPYYAGCAMNLGPSACLRIEGVRIVLASYKSQMADQSMFRFVGIEPEQMKVLVLKSAVHFRADFGSISDRIIVGAAPGGVSMRTTDLPWERLPAERLLYPGGPSLSQWRIMQSEGRAYSQ